MLHFTKEAWSRALCVCMCVWGGCYSCGQQRGRWISSWCWHGGGTEQARNIYLRSMEYESTVFFLPEAFSVLIFSSLSYFCTKPEFMGGYLHEIGISYKRRLEMLQFECGIIHSDEVTL